MTLRDDEGAFLVHEVARAHSPRYRAVNAVPLSFEVRLDLFQTVKCAHFLLGAGFLGPRRRLIWAVRARSIVLSHLRLLRRLLLVRGACETRIVVIVKA